MDIRPNTQSHHKLLVLIQAVVIQLIALSLLISISSFADAKTADYLRPQQPDEPHGGGHRPHGVRAGRPDAGLEQVEDADGHSASRSCRRTCAVPLPAFPAKVGLKSETPETYTLETKRDI